MGRFDGKVVLVTGGNRNTGLDLVEKFAREGAKVFMCGSSEASTAKGAEELKARAASWGHTTLPVVSQTCNIADLGEVTALFETIEREAGRLDILVNNAANQGLGHGGPLEMERVGTDPVKRAFYGGFAFSTL